MNGLARITGSQCNGTNQSPLNIVDTFGSGHEHYEAVYDPNLQPLNVTYTEQERYEVSVVSLFASRAAQPRCALLPWFLSRPRPKTGCSLVLAPLNKTF